MAFSLFSTVFADSVTAIPSAFLNKLRTEMPSAVDGRGGVYTNTSLLRFVGSGADIELAGDGEVNISPVDGTNFSTAANFASDVGVTGDVAIDATGTLTFEGSNTWPILGSRDLYLWDFPEIAGIGAGMVGEIDVGADSAIPVVAIAASTVTGESYLKIPKGPQGAALVSVHVVTKGVSGQGAGTLNLPKYRVTKQAWGTPGSAGFGAGSFLSSDTTDSHTTGPGNWETTYVETVVTVSGSPAYAPESATYHLRVTRPFNSSDNTGLYIAAIAARYQPAQLRF